MKRVRLSNGFMVTCCLIILGVLLSFSEREMLTDNAFKSMEVIMLNNDDNHYIDDSDVINSTIRVFDEEGADVNLRKVELALLDNPYIRDAQVYKDLKNNLIIKVELRRPLARLVRKNRSHAYISYDGHLLPVSSRYSSHVPLISGAYAEGFDKESVFEREQDIEVFNLLNAIGQDEFFRVQITQLEIDKKLNIKIYPQVTKQIVEFGKPVDVEEKFRKLMIFYHQILPQKGWNSYSRVNVNFKGQIVAE